MRTTLDIDDDVLTAAKELAKAQRTTAGRVVSDLVRQTLTKSAPPASRKFRNDVPLFPKANTVVTKEMIDKLVEDDA